jgi:hypothetical protein
MSLERHFRSDNYGTMWLQAVLAFIAFLGVVAAREVPSRFWIMRVTPRLALILTATRDPGLITQQQIGVLPPPVFYGFLRPANRRTCAVDGGVLEYNLRDDGAMPGRMAFHRARNAMPRARALGIFL